jgi:hypothetical protein
MAETSLVKKLNIKPGYKVLILNAPQEYQLGELPEGVEIATNGSGTFELVQLFVYSRADIEQKALAAIQAVKPGSLLWFAYPKKTGKIKTDISRDSGWNTVVESGWEPVTQIAIDERWSALRFRPLGEIKVMTRKKKMGVDKFCIGHPAIP